MPTALWENHVLGRRLTSRKYQILALLLSSLLKKHSRSILKDRAWKQLLGLPRPLNTSRRQDVQTITKEGYMIWKFQEWLKFTATVSWVVTYRQYYAHIRLLSWVSKGKKVTLATGTFKIIPEVHRTAKRHTSYL